MNRIRIRRPRARALSPDPHRPGHRPVQGRSRGPRVPERRPGHDGLGRRAPMAGCLDNDPRGPDGPPRAGAHVGMHLADQRGGAAHRSRSAALGSVAGRLPAHRQPPAGSGPERNRAVTRAGGRGPRSRPQHRQRIRQDHPEPPDRHPLHREPSVMCPPRRRPANVRSSPAGTNIRAHHRQPAHRHAGASGRQRTLARALHEYGRLVRTICICRYVVGEELRRRHAASSTRARACCPPPVPACCRHG